MGIIGILGSLGMIGGGHNRLIRHGREVGIIGILGSLGRRGGWACWVVCSDCGAGVGGGAEIVYNLYTFFGVGSGVVVSLHQKIDEGAALPGKPAMM